MRPFALFWLLWLWLRNPYVALLVLVLVYVWVDRRFIGLMPDLLAPLRRRARLRRLEETLRANPADAVSRLELGGMLLERGDAQAALTHLEAAAQRLGDHANAQMALGAALVAAGRHDEGAARLQRALELNPKVGYGEPFVHLAAAALGGTGRTFENAELEAALDELEERLEAFDSTELSARLGQLYAAHGRLERSRRAYRRALELYRQSPGFLRKKHRRWAVRAALGSLRG